MARAIAGCTMCPATRGRLSLHDCAGLAALLLALIGVTLAVVRLAALFVGILAGIFAGRARCDHCIIDGGWQQWRKRVGCLLC